MRVCGLKLTFVLFFEILHASHPMRVCGLKLKNTMCTSADFGVTPYAGVWIETESKTRVI